MVSESSFTFIMAYYNCGASGVICHAFTKTIYFLDIDVEFGLRTLFNAELGWILKDL